MSKALCSYPESERRDVIQRRLARPMYGLGWLSAYDAKVIREGGEKRPPSRKKGGKSGDNEE